jgi:oligoribonuclease (3'-5' exoribonuclease)
MTRRWRLHADGPCDEVQAASSPMRDLQHRTMPAAGKFVARTARPVACNALQADRDDFDSYIMSRVIRFAFARRLGHREDEGP